MGWMWWKRAELEAANTDTEAMADKILKAIEGLRGAKRKRVLAMCVATILDEDRARKTRR